MAGSKGSKYYDIFLDYSINLDHRELGNILNSNKFKLLQSIEQTGSLKSAANELGISYRKAWGIVDDIEKAMGFKLVNKQRGGANGGETTLTENGLTLMEAHKELRAEFDTVVNKISKKFFHRINK